MALAMALPDRLQRRPQLPREQCLAMSGMKARPEVPPPLARFIKHLASRGIVEFGPPLARGEKGPVVVDRVQQCAFLAPCHGLDMGFEFAAYSNGPVSDELANGAYRLSREDKAAGGAPAWWRTAARISRPRPPTSTKCFQALWIQESRGPRPTRMS